MNDWVKKWGKILYPENSNPNTVIFVVGQENLQDDIIFWDEHNWCYREDMSEHDYAMCEPFRVIRVDTEEWKRMIENER